MSGRANLEAAFGGPQARAAREATPAKATEARGRRRPPDVVHNVAVYLPTDLLAALRASAKARRCTITEIVEEAFVAHGANWLNLGNTAARPRGTMPARQTPRREGVSQVQLRLDGAQHQWLDDQVRIYSAPSRSALVTAVLRRHLY